MGDFTVANAIDLIKAFLSQWDSIEGVTVRLIDFVENMIMTFFAK